MISFFNEKPLACWKGKDVYRGSVLDCLTVIFKTGGCSWNRCRMCGYRHERYPPMAPADLTTRLVAQMAWVQREYPQSDYQMVKIFTSGSFFDADEVPASARRAILAGFRGKLVIAETRPEYVAPGAIREGRELIDDGSWDCPLYVATGLETTSDFIREKCIDKGFRLRDFHDAVAAARAGGAGMKTYLMMKPPFLTEREAMDDMQRSIEEAAPVSDMISMNLCTVQNRTDVEYYWKRGMYRPPYLWSALAVLAAAPVHVSCDPVGGGKKRGPHNCGSCDFDIVRGIREYSLSGDRDLLAALMETECRCKEEWEFVLAGERPYCMPLTR
ncbi:MAG TPA: TIGR01210 family radical SAM protein [Methanoculleus sp.]|nr:TIGR01210 family radical SAM protein [Methanoculleus sp.]